MFAGEGALGEGVLEPPLGRIVHVSAPLVAILPCPERAYQGVDAVSHQPHVVEAHLYACGGLEVPRVVLKGVAQLDPREPAAHEGLEHSAADALELDYLVGFLGAVLLADAAAYLPAYHPGVLVVGAYGAGAEAQRHAGAGVAVVGAHL